MHLVTSMLEATNPRSSSSVGGLFFWSKLKVFFKRSKFFEETLSANFCRFSSHRKVWLQISILKALFKVTNASVNFFAGVFCPFSYCLSLF